MMMIGLRVIFSLIWSFRHASSSGVVYVKEGAESAGFSCGSKKLPCNSLQQGVNNCNKGGTVIVEGVHDVSSEVEVTKDVNIVGLRGATITGNKISGQYVFSITRRVTFSITGVLFRDAQVVSFRSMSAILNITSCIVESSGNSGHVFNLLKLSALTRGTVTIINSIFNVHHGIHITDAAFFKLKLDNCTISGSGMVVKGRMQETAPNQFIFKKSVFSNIKGGALVIADHLFSITITDSTFKNCSVAKSISNVLKGDRSNGGAISMFGKGNSRSSVILKRCLFDGNVNDKFGGGDIRMRLVGGTTRVEDCEFQNSRATEGHGGSIRILPSHLFIKRSNFTNCSAAGKGGAILISDRVAVIDNRKRSRRTIFDLLGGAVRIPLSTVNAVMKNCSLMENKAGRDGGGVAVDMQGTLQVQSCEISRNVANRGGGIFITVYKRSPLLKRAQSIITDSIFSENMATVGGGVYSDKQSDTFALQAQFFGERLSTLISQCQFLNNSARSSGQSIYSNNNIRLDRIEISVVENFGAPHLHTDKGFGEFIELNKITLKLSRDAKEKLKDKSLGVLFRAVEIRLSGGLTLQCPKQFNVDTVRNETGDEKIFDEANTKKSVRIRKYTFLSVDCIPCGFASYTLHTGRYHIEKLPSPGSFNVSTQSEDFQPTINNDECVPCPTGAICDISVKAVDNFWGYENTESSLAFKICPHGFCCGSDTVPCISHDTCAVGRKGTLCGSCSEGYKQNFFGSDCIPKGEPCDVQMFIIYSVLYTIAYTTVFIIITNIKVITVAVRRLVSKQPFTKEEDAASEEEGKEDDFSMGGFVQITVLFFQVAGLLQVKFQDGKQQKNSSSNEGAREIITEFFNFRYALYQQVCPSDDLTLLEKEKILFTMKMATFVILFLIVIFHQLFRIFYIYCRCSKVQRTALDAEEPGIELMSQRNVEEGQSNCSVENVTTLSFQSMLKCTFIKLLKLYFAPITNSALMLVHCVSVHNESRLYVFGDHACYSGWQMGVICIILPSVLMFPICFELALRLLKKRQISSWLFVFSVLCPPFAVLMYVIRRNNQAQGGDSLISPEEELFRRTILEGEELLFKEIDGHSVGWQIVQLYRTFAITVLNTFITNPLYRQIAYFVLLMAFTAHDTKRQPYRHDYLNTLQSLSSRCLMVVLACNIIPAVSYLFNVQTVPQIYEVVKILGVVELVVYAVVPSSLAVWKVKTLVENKRKEKRLVKE